MNWRDWTVIVEDSDARQLLEKHQPKKLVLEICGVDSHGRFFIEKTEAKTDADGLREFRLKAAVESDEILSIRPVPVGPAGENSISSSLFRVCNVQHLGAVRIVQARIFEPLPGQPRTAQSS